GVLMLADGIEAASRTLVEPTPSKIRTLIRTIAEDCLRDGQLDETDLTLRDLSRIAEAFFRGLANIFHPRIDYPGFDFNIERGDRGERSREGRDTRERRVPTGTMPAASAAVAGAGATGPVKVS